MVAKMLPAERVGLIPADRSGGHRLRWFRSASADHATQLVKALVQVRGGTMLPALVEPGEVMLERLGDVLQPDRMPLPHELASPVAATLWRRLLGMTPGASAGNELGRGVPEWDRSLGS
jgi:hypothetical protein